MRRVSAEFSNAVATRVHRVAAIDDIATEWQPGLRLLARASAAHERAVVERLRAGGLLNLGWVDSPQLEVGDIVVPQTARGQATVLVRESDVHHGLLLTNRCNSYCVMCSQPPTLHDDSWLVDEALDVVRHLRISPDVLGLSGGEPLLLGHGLRQVIDEIAARHPTTRTEVLTNGRLLGREDIAGDLLTGLRANVAWLVPLYGHADFIHDFVVQTPGAFEETLAGVLALQEHGQPVQLRIVLIEPVLRILPELCGFVARNLPFVQVALMACEPTGFALANREMCAVDLADWQPELEAATTSLRRHGVPFLFMNTPLCALPRSLWPHAHKSISDWKNVYADECSRCAVRSRCCGLFAWHDRGWKPTTIHAIEEVTT